MKIKISILFILLMKSALIGCFAAESNENKNVDLSVKELILSRDSLNGHFVRVHGWIEIDPETFRLWGSQESMKNGIENGDCTGVVVPDGLIRKKYDGKHVIVYGEFISDIVGKYVVLGGCRRRSFIFVEKIEFFPLKQ